MIKNVASVNEDLDPTVMIGRLKGEMRGLQEEIRFLKGEAGEGEALTEDEVNELKRQVEVYVNNKDPYATLQLGKMTLTKLKDAFGVFKNLVLQARADARKVAGSGESGDGDFEDPAGAAGGTSASSEEVETLKAKLRQRDQEIAILVNMVKQAKGGIAAAPLAPSSAPPTAEAKSLGQPQQQVHGAGAVPVPGLAVAGGNSATAPQAWGAPSPGPAESKAAPPAETKAEANVRRLASRTIHGVTVTTDSALLEDAQAAFLHFRQQSTRAQAIEDNKRVLKDKFERAKQLAEQVNATRSTINYLKTTIEQIRRERAMEGLRGDEGGGAGGEGGGSDGAAGESEAEEQRLMDGMEREKGVYKRSFQELRELKAAIEHIQKLLEKSRHKLQDDFDEWYQACLNTEARIGPRAGPSQEASQAPSPVNGGWGTGEQSQQQATPPLQHEPQPSNARWHGASPQPAHARSPGVALTGNKEADADIMAFNRAREELLRRQQQDKLSS